MTSDRYCIALDLDGTLLTSDKQISPCTRDILCKAMEAGHEVLVASGRSFASLPREILHFPGIRYAVTGNGAAIYDIPGRRRICGFVMDPPEVDRVLQLLPDHRLLECFIDGVPYTWAPYVEDPAAYGLSRGGADYIRATRRPVEDIRGFIRENRHRLDALDVITTRPEEMVPIRRLLTGKLENTYITSSAPILLELSNREAGKHHALAKMCRLLEIPLSRCIAFGDGENDMEMLRLAGIGVAMGNAAPEVRAAADVTADTNDRDGAARMLARILELGPIT